MEPLPSNPYLQARLAKRVSIEDAAHLTRLPIGTLRRIESEELDQMKGDTYGRAYLRSYGDFLGLDSDELLPSILPAYRLGSLEFMHLKKVLWHWIDSKNKRPTLTVGIRTSSTESQGRLRAYALTLFLIVGAASALMASRFLVKGSPRATIAPQDVPHYKIEAAKPASTKLVSLSPTIPASIEGKPVLIQRAIVPTQTANPVGQPNGL
jgi:Helix-turn-helix domain